MENNNKEGLSEEMVVNSDLKLGERHSRCGKSMCKDPKISKSPDHWISGKMSSVWGCSQLGVRVGDVSRYQILVAQWAMGRNLDFFSKGFKQIVS